MYTYKLARFNIFIQIFCPVFSPSKWCFTIWGKYNICMLCNRVYLEDCIIIISLRIAFQFVRRVQYRTNFALPLTRIIILPVAKDILLINVFICLLGIHTTRECYCAINNSLFDVVTWFITAQNGLILLQRMRFPSLSSMLHSLLERK